MDALVHLYASVKGQDCLKSVLLNYIASFRNEHEVIEKRMLISLKESKKSRQRKSRVE